MTSKKGIALEKLRNRYEARGLGLTPFERQQLLIEREKAEAKLAEFLQHKDTGGNVKTEEKSLYETLNFQAPPQEKEERKSNGK